MKWVKHPKLKKDIESLAGNRTLDAIGDSAEDIISRLVDDEPSLEDIRNFCQGFEKLQGGQSGYTYYSLRLNNAGRMILAVHNSSGGGIIVGVTPTHNYASVMNRELSPNLDPVHPLPVVPIIPLPRPGGPKPPKPGKW